MRASLSKLGDRLRSSLRDGILIVVSILIAFFLDAWWDEQVEQREISDNLRAVYVDFSSTKGELGTVMETNVAYMDGVTTLISITMDDLQSLDNKARADLTYLIPRGGITFDPVLGSVEALISSGQLNRVRNLQLRSLIGAWPALMDEIGEDQQILIDTYMSIQERNVKLGIYLASLRSELSNASAQSDNEILARVIQDPEMLNRLAAHRFAVQSLNEELGEVAKHLDRILKMLGHELGTDKQE